MPLLDDVRYWSFVGTAFAVRIQAQDWEQWFDETVIATTEPILDSNDAFTDIGGKQWQPLPLRCEFDTVSERQAFNAMVGTVGVLINPGGDSHTVLLERAKKIGSGLGLYTLDVVFRPV